MQLGFFEQEGAAKENQTRHAPCLAEIEALTPWPALRAEDKSSYPTDGGRDRSRIRVGRMRRMSVAQQCFGLSHEGIENAIYGSQAFRAFVGIDLTREAAADATVLLSFPRRLVTHGLSQKIFEQIKANLADKGLMLRGGTIVDATIIAAAASAKNRANARNPEMHQTDNLNQRCFGIKVRIGVNAQPGLVHAVVATVTHVSDVDRTYWLPHGEETEVFGDTDYQGVDRNKRNALPTNGLGNLLEQLKRAKADHPLHVIKNLFKRTKTRNRGLAKSEAQLLSLFGMANLFVARRPLSARHPQGAF